MTVKYKDIANRIDKDELIDYYKTHLPKDVMKKFEDKFIEFNRWWHHGTHPFDETNKEDIKLLNEWKIKAVINNQYSEAIKTWTIRDVEKINSAKRNNLNYELIY